MSLWMTIGLALVVTATAVLIVSRKMAARNGRDAGE